MNKKFSTLMAAFLAAGAWTTANADLLKVDPVVGGTYLIGTEVSEADEEITGLWGGSSCTLTSAATSISDMDEAWTLVPVADKDGQFYLKNEGGQVLCISTAATATSSFYSWNGTIDAKSIKFKLEDGGLVVAERVEDGGNYFVEGTPLVFTGSRPVIDYNNPTGDPTELAFAVYNDDVNVDIDLAEDKTPLQPSFEKDEYYLIASTNTYLLTDDGAGKVSTAPNTNVTADNIDNYLWKITEGTAADGKTKTYTFTNKKSGKNAIISKIDKFIVKGSAASFELYLNEDQGLTASLTAGIAAEFGVYKSPVLNVAGKTLNDLLGDGFNMTIKKDANDKDEIEGLAAFSGKLKATKDANRFQLMSDDKYVVLNKKATWDGVNVGSNDRGYKFELVDEVKDDQLSWFEFTAYAGNTKSEVVKVSVYADEDDAADDDFGSLYILSLQDLNCLTTSKALVGSDNVESWPYITLTADNIVKPEDFLKNAFYTVTEVESDKVLAVVKCVPDAINHEDTAYVESVGNELEAQWAITYDAEKALYTFKNRENVAIQWDLNVSDLREDDNTEDEIYVINGVSYQIATVTDAKEDDGYMWLGDVKNQRYAMGYYVKALEEGEYLWFVGDKEGNISFEKSNDASVATEMVAGEKVDTVKVESVITYYDATKKEFATAKPVLKVPVYTFAKVNAEKGEYFGYDKQYVFDAATAEKLTIREDDGQYNLRLAKDGEDDDVIFDTYKIYAGASADYLDKTNCVYDDTKNDLFTVVALNRPEYRRLGATVENDGLTDMDVNTVRINRANVENTYLYVNSANRNANNGEAILDFLGETNLADKPANASLAIFVDTAYVRNETTEPLYLLSVLNTFVEEDEGELCPICGEADCEHSKAGFPAYRTGDYLVGLEDSAYVDPAAADPKEVYIEQALYQGNVRLAFVNATHVGDSLIIDNSKFTGDKKWAKNDTLSFVNAKGEQVENVATFSFRLVDPASTEGDFYIETVNKAGKDMYVRIHNSVPVLVSELDEAATFNIAQTDEQATDNEEISASEVTVIAGNGQITINGAAGKKVVVSNILGQVVANTVLTSDNATIAAPQGVVVVAVEGEEAVKAIVK